MCECFGVGLCVLAYIFECECMYFGDCVFSVCLIEPGASFNGIECPLSSGQVRPLQAVQMWIHTSDSVSLCVFIHLHVHFCV